MSTATSNALVCALAAASVARHGESCVHMRMDMHMGIPLSSLSVPSGAYVPSSEGCGAYVPSMGMCMGMCVGMC